MSFTEGGITFYEPSDLSIVSWNDALYMRIENRTTDQAFHVKLEDVTSKFALATHTTHFSDALRSSLGGNAQVVFTMLDKLVLGGGGASIILQPAGNIQMSAPADCSYTVNGGEGNLSLQIATTRTTPGNTNKGYIGDFFNLWACTAASKTNKAPIQDVHTKIQALNGITFEQNGIPGTGITFEDLEATGLPGIVRRDESDVPESINLLAVVPLLVEAVKLLQQEVAALKGV